MKQCFIKWVMDPPYDTLINNDFNENETAQLDCLVLIL